MAEVLLRPIILFTVFYTACEAQSNTVALKSVEKCPVENPPDIEFELFTNDNNELALNVRSSYGYDIDENYKIKLDLFELKNGDWVPLTDFNNPWCEVVSLLDQLWRKAKAATQPPIPDGCIIPAGEHKVDGLHFTQKEMMAYAATIDRGSYKGDFLLYIDEDGNKEDVLCLITKYDIIEM